MIRKLRQWLALYHRALRAKHFGELGAQRPAAEHSPSALPDSWSQTAMRQGAKLALALLFWPVCLPWLAVMVVRWALGCQQGAPEVGLGLCLLPDRPTRPSKLCCVPAETTGFDRPCSTPQSCWGAGQQQQQAGAPAAQSPARRDGRRLAAEPAAFSRLRGRAVATVLWHSHRADKQSMSPCRACSGSRRTRWHTCTTWNMPSSSWSIAFSFR